MQISNNKGTATAVLKSGATPSYKVVQSLFSTFENVHYNFSGLSSISVHHICKLTL